MTLTPEQNKEVLQIVQRVFKNNYLSGSPAIPPHTHNGIDNLQIPYSNLTGVPSETSSTFKGTGADGALVISSSATNIDLGNAPVFTKNYTSISITGTGYLTSTNPASGGTYVILKSQGDVTITSSAAAAISMVGLGAGHNTAGIVFVGAIGATTDGGGPGSGSPGTGGTKASVAFDTTTFLPPNIPVVIGGGSGSGGNGSGTGPGIGGTFVRGGGGLLIQCGGALNFGASATISANGVAGNNGTNATNGGGGGGSGGGGGGSVVILYNTLTANSGTITVSGGTHGSGGTGAGIAGCGGGAGGSITAGTNGIDPGGNPGINGGNGGDGGNGFYLVAQNTYFV